MNQFDEIIHKRKQFNDKPFGHWQEQADELVTELIVRAALQHTDERSLIGHIARKRLLEIARIENPTLFEKVLEIRVRCLEGFAYILQSILS